MVQAKQTGAGYVQQVMDIPMQDALALHGNWPGDHRSPAGHEYLPATCQADSPGGGRQFGQVPYIVVILKAVEEEVHRNPKAAVQKPWFDEPEFARERMAKTRLSAAEKQEMNWCRTC